MTAKPGNPAPHIAKADNADGQHADGDDVGHGQRLFPEVSGRVELVVYGGGVVHQNTSTEQVARPYENPVSSLDRRLTLTRYRQQGSQRAICKEKYNSR